MAMILRMKQFACASVLLAAFLLAPCMAQAAYASKVIDKQAPVEAIQNIPPALQGKAFGLYYKGPAVELVKMRLQELGYYTRMLTFNEKFDDTLRSRVREFQRNNGLEENGKIDELTLCALYGENPVKGKWYNGSDKEPDISLIIPITKSAQWYLSAENEIGFRVTVKNISDKRTITAYEVAIYAMDMQGRRVHETPGLVMSGKIGPGETAWTSYVTMTDPDEIREVYVALKRVRYADGSYRLIEEPKYDCFVLHEPQGTATPAEAEPARGEADPAPGETGGGQSTALDGK